MGGYENGTTITECRQVDDDRKRSWGPNLTSAAIVTSAICWPVVVVLMLSQWLDCGGLDLHFW